MRRWLAIIAALGLLAAEPAAVELRAPTPSADAPFAAALNLSQGHAALEARDWARARASFEAVLMLDPELIEARIGAADAALGAGDLNAADRWLDGVDAPVTRLLLDARLDRLDDPEGALRSAFEATPDPRLLNTLGRWLDDRGRGEAARQAFMRAHSHQRPGAAHNNVGLSFLRAGNLNLAQSAFDRAVALNAADPVFTRNRRLCALMRHDYAAALSGVSRADAAPVLREAGARALEAGDVRLAALMLTRSETLSVRHDPRLAMLQERLEQVNRR